MKKPNLRKNKDKELPVGEPMPPEYTPMSPPEPEPEPARAEPDTPPDDYYVKWTRDKDPYGHPQ